MALSFTAQLEAFEVKTLARANEFVIKLVLEFRTRLIVRSPVDTGRFRNNWQYGLDLVPQGVIGERGDKFDKSGGAAMTRIQGQIATRAIGHAHYLVNNLPYATSLERGWSKQAPQGMVRLTFMELGQICQRVRDSLS